jgi:ABC-type Mn2+/Zn2+ transport system permease subunit
MSYQFMQRAFISATLVGGLCAVIGVFVILRGMAFIGAGIAHASFGGVALGFLIEVNPLYSALGFSIATAWAIGFISEKGRIREDIVVGVFFASTMAFGVLLIGFIKGYTVDIFSYIFGNILTISKIDLVLTAILAIIVIAILYIFYKEFLFITYDIEMALVTGLPVRMLNFLMLTLIALVIVISIKAVGIVLVSALVVTPAAAALQLTFDFKKMIGLSAIIGISSSWIGLLFSVLLDLPSGQPLY